MKKETIYKEDALKALVQCHKYCINPFDSYHIDIEDAEARIRRVPPAQQKSECDYWDSKSSSCVLYKPFAQSELQWIPCKERIPTEGEPFYVLCCDKYGGIMIGHVSACNDGKTPYLAENEYEYMYDCRAWMPLPKPWEGEQK